MTHEIHKSVERILKPGALVMGTFLVGGLVEFARTVHEKRQPDIADVISYYEDDGPSFIFLRGCGEHIPAQAPILHRKLGGYGSMHFEYQTQGRHSQKIIDQNIIKACQSDGDRDRVLIGTSMGLMNGMRSLRNPAVREAVGKNRLKAIVSRSGITSRYDLQENMQDAAQGASLVPALPTIGDGWRIQRLQKAKGKIAHSPETTDAEALLHYQSSANMPYPLVASQYRAIHESEAWDEGSHFDVVVENPDMRLFQITAEYDAVANWQVTNTSLERSFGLPVETVPDGRRSHGSHADDFEFIEPLEELMMKLSGRHRSVAQAARNLAAYSGGHQLEWAS